MIGIELTHMAMPMNQANTVVSTVAGLSSLGSA